MNVHSPTNLADLRTVVADAAAAGGKLEIIGGGSKTGIGAPRQADRLDMTALRGVIDYDPAELVLVVHAGTPLAEVESLLASQRQMLAFDPFDHGPLFGRAGRAATIGGIVAAGISGPSRLRAGACRDHLLGFSGVTGRGDLIEGGSRVVKNVTGFDLPKLIAGSWGRLVALAQVTLRVVPAPETRATFLIKGLSPQRAQRAMASALGSQASIAAAAHVAPDVRDCRSRTCFRIEGITPSVEARAIILRCQLADWGTIEYLDDETSTVFWATIRDASILPRDLPLWRISVPPRQGPHMIAFVEEAGGHWLADWGGGLLWAAVPESVALREAAVEAGGHAMLVRAPAAMRARVSTFQTSDQGVAELERRLRLKFDPTGVFDVGRFQDPCHAH